MPVAHVHQREADGGTQEAVEGVQHGIPVGEGGVKGPDLAQNLSGEDKEKNDDLQGVGQINLQAFFKNGGQEEEDQSQHAEKNVFKVAVKELSHHHQDHQQPQYDVHRRHHALFSQRAVGGDQKVGFFLACHEEPPCSQMEHLFPGESIP